jgi:hypothetical protein
MVDRSEGPSSLPDACSLGRAERQSVRVPAVWGRPASYISIGGGVELGN